MRPAEALELVCAQAEPDWPELSRDEQQAVLALRRLQKALPDPKLLWAMDPTRGRNQLRKLAAALEAD